MANRVYLGAAEPRFPGDTDACRMVYVTHEDQPRARYIEANVWNWIDGHGLIVGGSTHRIGKAILRSLPSRPHTGHLSARQVAGELAEQENDDAD